MTDDFSDVVTKVVTDMSQNIHSKDTEMIEVTGFGEDLTADKWITWVNEKPQKNSNAVYLYPHLWDTDFDPFQSMCHDDHSYADKAAVNKSFTI